MRPKDEVRLEVVEVEEERDEKPIFVVVWLCCVFSSGGYYDALSIVA